MVLPIRRGVDATIAGLLVVTLDFRFDGVDVLPDALGYAAIASVPGAFTEPATGFETAATSAALAVGLLARGLLLVALATHAARHGSASASRAAWAAAAATGAALALESALPPALGATGPETLLGLLVAAITLHALWLARGLPAGPAGSAA